MLAGCQAATVTEYRPVQPDRPAVSGVVQVTDTAPEYLMDQGYLVLGAVSVRSEQLACYRDGYCEEKRNPASDTTTLARAEAAKHGGQVLALVSHNQRTLRHTERSVCDQWQTTTQKIQTKDSKCNTQTQEITTTDCVHSRMVPGVAEVVASEGVILREDPAATDVRENLRALTAARLELLRMPPPSSVTSVIRAGAQSAKAGSPLVTPLTAAAEKGDLDLVRRLTGEGAEINPKGYTPLMAAARFGHMEVLNFLLERGANPKLRTDLWSVLFVPVNQDVSTLALPTPQLGEGALTVGPIPLLQYRRGWSAMSLAGAHGHLDIARRLHALGVDY